VYVDGLLERPITKTPMAESSAQERVSVFFNRLVRSKWTKISADLSSIFKYSMHKLFIYIGFVEQNPKETLLGNSGW